MLRGGAHGVVGNARRGGAADPGWVGEERVETTVATLRMVRDVSVPVMVGVFGHWKKRVRSGILMRTHIVKIDVNTTEMREDEVANRVRALNGLGVVGEGIQEPWVFGSYKCVRLLVGPKLCPALARPPPTF